MVIRIKRKIITLCLGLAISTIFAPQTICMNNVNNVTPVENASQAIDFVKNVKIGALALVGGFFGYYALKTMSFLTKQTENPEQQTFYNLARQQNNPLVETLSPSQIETLGRTICGALLLIYSLISYYSFEYAYHVHQN